MLCTTDTVFKILNLLGKLKMGPISQSVALHNAVTTCQGQTL